MQDQLHPIPFVIQTENLPASISHLASNGNQIVSVQDRGAKMFMRRAVKGLQMKPAAEQALPLVNQLAGDLLNDSNMTAAQVQQRLLAIAGLIPVPNPQRVEWLVVELDGVRVYCDGNNVLVTKEEIAP